MDSLVVETAFAIIKDFCCVEVTSLHAIDCLSEIQTQKTLRKQINSQQMHCGDE